MRLRIFPEFFPRPTTFSCHPEVKTDLRFFFPWRVILTEIFIPPRKKNQKGLTIKQKTRTARPVQEPWFFHAAQPESPWQFKTTGTFYSKTPDILYVSLPWNIRFPRRKPTFHGRETYGSPDGNIENLKKKEIYRPSISSIRNAWRRKNGAFEKQMGCLQGKISRCLQERLKKRLTKNVQKNSR